MAEESLIQYSALNSPGPSYESYDDSDRSSSKLLWRLDTKALLKLRKYFHKYEEDFAEVIIPNDNYAHREKRTLFIDKEEFEKAISVIFGHTRYSSESSKMFQMLDTDKSGYIWWEEMMDKLLEIGEERTRNILDGWTPVEKDGINIMEIQHCKKESVSFVLSIETEEFFCYAVISRHGKVGIYNGKFKLFMEYDVFFNRTGVSRRVRDMWITAAIYLEDSKTIVMTASDRSMMIYEASTLCHVATFLITGFTYITTSLAYCPSKSKISKSYLVMGDDQGSLTVITFKQPRVSLFHKKIQEKLNNYFWIDLQCILQESYCEIKVHRRLHSRSVKRISYLRHNDTIVSCSNDPSASLIIRHRMGILEPYVFKVPRGISCFHFSESLGLLATGSSDGVIRIWEPVLPNKPTAIFPAQNCPVLDLVVLAHNKVIVSFNKSGVLKFWDILDQVCLQSVPVRFPSFGILGKLIQFGVQSIYSGPARKKTNVEDALAPPYKRRVSIPQLQSRRSSKMTLEDGIVLKYDDPIASEKDNDLNKDDSMANNMTEYNRWMRPEIVVTCCNYLAVIKIEEWTPAKKENVIIDYSSVSSVAAEDLLPPPDKAHRPRKPSLWDNDQYHIDPLPYETSSEDKASSKSSSVLGMDKLSIPDVISDHDNYLSNLEYDNMQSLEGLLENAGLTGILEKDFISKFGVKHDLNTKLAQQRPKQEKMRLHVAQGAPYSALDLFDPAEIKFSSPLPLSTRMQKKSGLDFFTEPQHLLRHNSCFSMETPRSSYSVSSKTSRSSVGSNRSIQIEKKL